MADAQNSEAYKFALGAGLEAGNNAAAAGGTQLSSSNVQDQQSTAEGIASQYEQQAFQQWLSNNNLTLGALQNMVATGQVSTQQLNQDLSNAGVNVASAQQAIGNAQATGTTNAADAEAAGVVGSGNAVAGGITGSANAQASGIIGAASANAGALTNSANIISQGATNIGNNLASAIPKGSTYEVPTQAPAVAPAIVNNVSGVVPTPG
jgi:hypothetical protein